MYFVRLNIRRRCTLFLHLSSPPHRVADACLESASTPKIRTNGSPVFHSMKIDIT